MALRAERSGPSGPRLDLMARARIIADLKDPHLLPMQLRDDGSGYDPAPFGGKTLAELRTSASGPPTLSFGLRILLDVLRGLAAVHGAKVNGSALGFVHGEVTPSHIVVGIDGKARLVPLVPAHWGAGPPSLPPDVVGYTAPERLLGDKYDQRADVFSAGVLLWESIMGEPLFRDRTPDAIVTRLIGGKVPYPVPSSDAPWAVPLSDVALGALSVEPRARCAHVGALGAQIEKIARGKLASSQELAALVTGSLGQGASALTESMPTVRQSSALAGSQLHPPSSAPAQPGSDTLGGASRTSSVGRTRRAEPPPERSNDPSSGTLQSAPAVGTEPTSSSSMRVAAASPSAPSPAVSAAPTLVSVVSAAPLPGPSAPPSSKRAPSSKKLIELAETLPVAPVEPVRRTAPPPMTAGRQWRIVGTALAVSFALAAIAAYALLDWNPVATANETILVPPPQAPPAVSAVAIAAGTPAKATPASSSSSTPAASDHPAGAPVPVAPAVPPRAAVAPPPYRPPAAAPPRPAPAAPPRPAPPPPAHPSPRPSDAPKQSETERFGI